MATTDHAMMSLNWDARSPGTRAASTAARSLACSVLRVVPCARAYRVWPRQLAANEAL